MQPAEPTPAGDPVAPTGEPARTGELASPVAVIHDGDLDHNISAMAAWCAQQSVQLAPHGKTTMAPQIFRRQLDAGAWGLTVASAAQARVAVAAGARRVLLANEVVDPVSVAVLTGLLRDHPGLAVWVYIDSPDGALLLDTACRTTGLADDPGVSARLSVLLELGEAGLRAGLRTDAEALDLARFTAARTGLRLAGAAGFEGVLGSDGAAGDAVARFCRRLVAVTGQLARVGLLTVTAQQPAVVSAGGSTYYDVVARELGHVHDVVGPSRPVEVVLRSGCYVTHDHGLYARSAPAARGASGPELRPALQVWARVLSRPEPTRAVLDAGRRDLSYDAELPVPLWIGQTPARRRPLRATVEALSDQHTWLGLGPDTSVAVGEWVGLGISHPCSTFDRWRELLLVDDDASILGTVETCF